MPTSAAIQEQEANRKYARVANAFDRARDWLARVTGQLTSARKAKKVVRIIELESEFSQASEALGKAAAEYEARIGVPAPLSTGPRPQVRPGTVLAFRATNDDFRRIDDEVSGCEREMNRLRSLIPPLEQTLDAQNAIPVFGGGAENTAAEAALDGLYPERVHLREDNLSRVQLLNTNNARRRALLAELKSQLETVTAKWNAARNRRDEMLTQLRNA